jgi:hypothetical protein
LNLAKIDAGIVRKGTSVASAYLDRSGCASRRLRHGRCAVRPSEPSKRGHCARRLRRVANPAAMVNRGLLLGWAFGRLLNTPAGGLCPLTQRSAYDRGGPKNRRIEPCCQAVLGIELDWQQIRTTRFKATKPNNRLDRSRRTWFDRQRNLDERRPGQPWRSTPRRCSVLSESAQSQVYLNAWSIAQLQHPRCRLKPAGHVARW